MPIYSGADYGEHRRADSQASCDSVGSSNTGHHRAQPLLITGNKTKDATFGEARIRAGEIIGWRYWKLHCGLLQSVFASYIWRPGVFERSSFQPPPGYHNSGYQAYDNVGYHAFKDRDQAERDASMYTHWWPAVIGCIAMWGEVIEHEYGWRSEYAAVRSLFLVTGDIGISNRRRFLLDLAEKYGCDALIERGEMQPKAGSG